MVEVKRQWPHLSGTLVVASLTSVGLFLIGAVRSGNFEYWFMVWNLFLAWLPLLFMMWLLKLLRRKRWTSWQGIGLSLLWLGFLPNSFYMISDYIHLQDIRSLDVLYDAVMLTAFVITGLMLGFISLYLFHLQLKKRLPAVTAARIIAFVLLLCSFAIYLGRDLRWNTWDLFINPASILFDVSDRLLNPRAHPQMFVTILSFFVLLALLYLVVWNAVRTLQATTQRPTRQNTN